MGGTLFYYNDQEDSIERCCEQLKEYIREEERINRIRLLPSTSLAIGYYRNFIEQLMNCLQNRKEIYIGEEKVELAEHPITVNILIPGDVETDWKKWGADVCDRKRTEKRNDRIRIQADCIYDRSREAGAGGQNRNYVIYHRQ